MKEFDPLPIVAPNFFPKNSFKKFTPPPPPPKKEKTFLLKRDRETFLLFFIVKEGERRRDSLFSTKRLNYRILVFFIHVVKETIN